MRVIILAGGLGTRISEETEDKPKPMVLVGENPILWHLMNIFSFQGFTEFVLALGYRGSVVKRWLSDLTTLDGDILFDLEKKKLKNISPNDSLLWKVTTLDTGPLTQTGGRILRCMNAFPGERVLVTYGDGLANINIKKLIMFHEAHGKMATVTAVKPPVRFGHMKLIGKEVVNFGEKNNLDAEWINGGFFILEPNVTNYIKGDNDSFEFDVLPKLVQERELMAFSHDGFWKPMDTLKEQRELNLLAGQKNPPWLEDI